MPSDIEGPIHTWFKIRSFVPTRTIFGVSIIQYKPCPERLKTSVIPKIIQLMSAFSANRMVFRWSANGGPLFTGKRDTRLMTS